MARYVVVNPTSKVIVGGPYLWDGSGGWVAPEITNEPGAGLVMTEEAIALDEGYTFPVVEDEGGDVGS